MLAPKNAKKHVNMIQVNCNFRFAATKNSFILIFVAFKIIIYIFGLPEARRVRLLWAYLLCHTRLPPLPDQDVRITRRSHVLHNQCVS